MLSLFKSCARLEQLFSARPISASGRTFAPAIPQAVGAVAAARREIHTRLIAIPAALAQAGTATGANLCAAAVGTETDGSVVCPSSANGLVGIKPTLGLVSRAGIIPIAHSQDTAGPMTRTVRDAAILLGALAGAGSPQSGQPRDPLTSSSRGH